MQARRIGKILLTALVIVAVACSWLDPIQSLANSKVDEGLERALLSFASARSLNAVISVIQGTEFSVQPLGVGVTLTLGQFLDPINDLVEQFSSLMLMASVALGTQKILLLMGGHHAVSGLLTACAVVWLLLFWRERSPLWLSKLLGVFILVRFVMPIAVLTTDVIFKYTLAGDYREQQTSLELATRQIEANSPKAPTTGSSTDQPPAAQAKGFFANPKEWIEAHTPSFDAIYEPTRKKYEAIKQSAEQIPEGIIKLIVIFLFQTALIPIGVLWALYMTARHFMVFRPTTP